MGFPVSKHGESSSVLDGTAGVQPLRFGIELDAGETIGDAPEPKKGRRPDRALDGGHIGKLVRGDLAWQFESVEYVAQSDRDDCIIDISDRFGQV